MPVAAGLGGAPVPAGVPETIAPGTGGDGAAVDAAGAAAAVFNAESGWRKPVPPLMAVPLALATATGGAAAVARGAVGCGDEVVAAGAVGSGAGRVALGLGKPGPVGAASGAMTTSGGLRAKIFSASGRAKPGKLSYGTSASAAQAPINPNANRISAAVTKFGPDFSTGCSSGCRK